MKFIEIPMPGDGNCMFHSISYGLNISHKVLREKIVNFILENPDFIINDTKLKDWIQWSENISYIKYAKNMAKNGIWGGGIELSIIPYIYNISICVLQKGNIKDKYKIISKFLRPNSKKIIFILYVGNCHYNYLELKKIDTKKY